MRKSLETEERQVLSLGTQMRRARETFHNLDIKRVYEERGSAFEPDKRSPVFAKLLRDIDSGYIQGIIAWHPDRLSRNEEDAAKITYRLRKGVIKDLKFCSYNFDNSPEGIMMLQLALSQSQYFSAKLSRDVKRGIDEKLRQGWRPGLPPPGYLNDRLEKTVVEDGERLPIIERMWLLLLTGQVTPPRIADLANNTWGFRTHPRKRSGGKPLSRSGIYKIFHNPFYAGYILHNGQLYKGAHRAIITMRQFEEAQRILTSTTRTRKTIVREFAYAQTIRCGECGCIVTSQLTKGNIYYHCTRRSTTVKCSQRKVAREDMIEGLLMSQLRQYAISSDFYKWALQKLDEDASAANKESQAIYRAQAKVKEDLEAELDGLIRMRARDLLDDAEFVTRRDKIRAALEDSEASIELKDPPGAEMTRRALSFAFRATQVLHSGDTASRRALVRSMSVTLMLKDGTLDWQPTPWLVPLKERATRSSSPPPTMPPPPVASHSEPRSTSASETQNSKVQTSKYLSTKGKTAAFTTVRPQWCSIVDELQTAITKAGPNLYIPEFDEAGQLVSNLEKPPNTS